MGKLIEIFMPILPHHSHKNKKYRTLPAPATQATLFLNHNR